ncbi:MAG TPA: hypothetical protein VFI42_05550 [Thermomicrobiaceae bacterium]|nr:hypothetical protein [Thermomicrobiaceae bacterium]
MPSGAGMSLGRLLAIYRRHFHGQRQERQFLASLGFLLTFATVRTITHAIRDQRGPFHNLSHGTTHIHHLVWGIFSLLGVGFLWLHQFGTGLSRASAWGSRLTALLYGLGAALTLDEFALWLDLEDVYWARQGRDSIDAVILFFATLSVGWWGRFFFRDLLRALFFPMHEAEQVAHHVHRPEPGAPPANSAPRS